jgi:hypothetical protein
MMVMMAEVMSQKRKIKECIESGDFVHVLLLMDIDDLVMIQMEVRRDKAIEEILSYEPEQIVAGIARLGWQGRIVAEIEHVG